MYQWLTKDNILIIIDSCIITTSVIKYSDLTLFAKYRYAPTLFISLCVHYQNIELIYHDQNP